VVFLLGLAKDVSLYEVKLEPNRQLMDCDDDENDQLDLKEPIYFIIYFAIYYNGEGLIQFMQR
jgi:hypothetical protein